MNRSLLFAALLLPSVGMALPVLDSAQKTRVNQSELRQQSVAPGQAPDGTPMLALTWNNSAANYLEFTVDKPVNLPEFDSAVLKLDLYWPENTAVGKLNLRITDSTGETLQYPLPIKELKPGRQTLEATLTPTSAGGSWGGNKNKKIDFPARVTGMSVDFNRKDGDGKLWLGKAELLPEVKIGKLIVDPAVAKVRIHDGAKRQQSAEAATVEEKSAYQVKWDAAAAKWLEFSFAPQLPVLPEFVSGRFEVELMIPESGKVGRVNLRLADKSGETFQYPLPITGLKPGWNVVALRINPADARKVGHWGGDKNHQLDFPVRLIGFSVDYPAGSGAGELAIGKVTFSE